MASVENYRYSVLFSTMNKGEKLLLTTEFIFTPKSGRDGLVSEFFRLRTMERLRASQHLNCIGMKI